MRSLALWRAVRVVLLDLPGPAQAGLQGRVVRADVGAPGAVALLQPHALDGPVARIDDAELRAGRPKRPADDPRGPHRAVAPLRARGGRAREGERPAPRARIGSAQGHDRSAGDPDGPELAEGEAPVGDVV